MGNRRMASWRLPSLPLPFSCRSCFQRRQDTVSTCKHHWEPLSPSHLKCKALVSTVRMSVAPQLAVAFVFCFAFQSASPASTSRWAFTDAPALNSPQRGWYPFPAGLSCDVPARIGWRGWRSWPQAWHCTCVSHMILEGCMQTSKPCAARAPCQTP